MDLASVLSLFLIVRAYDDDELPLKSDFFFYPSFEDKKIEVGYRLNPLVNFDSLVGACLSSAES